MTKVAELYGLPKSSLLAVGGGAVPVPKTTDVLADDD